MSKVLETPDAILDEMIEDTKELILNGPKGLLSHEPKARLSFLEDIKRLRKCIKYSLNHQILDMCDDAGFRHALTQSDQTLLKK